MKKGLSYVDWSISVGLFIVYLLVLFILLAPAFKSAESSDYLNNILKNGLDENITLELKKFPIYVKVITADSIFHRFTVGDLPEEFEEVIADGGESGTEKFTLYTQDEEEIDYRGVSHTGNTLAFKTYHADMGVTGNGQIGELPIYISPNEKVFISLGTPITPADTQSSDTTIGVAETITGIYENKFTKFFYGNGNLRDYTEVKNDLKYPEKNDFTVLIESIETEGDCYFDTLTYSDPEHLPKDRDLVNTLVYSDWVIRINDPPGTAIQRCPAQVTLKTW
jgi:hypothetical protein